MATSQQGSESDLLHFTIHDAQGAERVMLPVFTQPEIMRAALARNPDWQTLSVLQVQGQALLENVHPDVIVVINPWSRLEFQLPRDRPGRLRRAAPLGSGSPTRTGVGVLVARRPRHCRPSCTLPRPLRAPARPPSGSPPAAQEGGGAHGAAARRLDGVDAVEAGGGGDQGGFTLGADDGSAGSASTPPGTGRPARMRTVDAGQVGGDAGPRVEGPDHPVHLLRGAGLPSRGPRPRG